MKTNSKGFFKFIHFNGFRSFKSGRWKAEVVTKKIDNYAYSNINEEPGIAW
jgi:hypothetical protein